MHRNNRASQILRRKGRRSLNAFTLVELLLVCAILIPKFSGRTEQARIAAAQTQISIFRTSLDAFEVDNGYYPKGEEGLSALVEEPSDSKTWKGPYLQQGIPTDPWGQPYVYEYPGKHNNKGYDLMCPGPDGQTGTEDDITNWETGK
jgi:general secretion pathway protein G